MSTVSLCDLLSSVSFFFIFALFSVHLLCTFCVFIFHKYIIDSQFFNRIVPRVNWNYMQIYFTFGFWCPDFKSETFFFAFSSQYYEDPDKAEDFKVEVLNRMVDGAKTIGVPYYSSREGKTFY